MQSYKSGYLMPRYKDDNNPDSKREKVPSKSEKASRSRYPTGNQMKKGSRLDCLACKGKIAGCKGCDGKGYIIV